MTDPDVQNFVEFCKSDFGTALMDREAAYIDEHLDDADRVLNIGSGIGAIEERLDYTIIGLDNSMAMLEEARRRTNNLYVSGDATDLPFPHDTFDAVISITALEFLDDYRTAINEAHRVLRPAGTFVALVLNPESKYFQRHLEKADSYFHNMRHEPAVIADYAADRFDIDTVYFLGIDGKDVFSSSEPTKAALYSVKGEAIREE